MIDKLNSKEPFYGNNFSIEQDIFSWNELESLLNLRPFINNTRFKATNQNDYTWNNQTWLTDVNTWPASLLSEVIRKDTCFIVDCSRVNKKINNICKIIEEKWKYPTDAHIYFSFKEQQKGFDSHWDYSNNLIVQIDGETNIKIWNELKYEGDRQVKSKSEPIIDIIMKPYDYVFVPKNMVHQAVPLSKRLSISFPMSTDTNIETQDRDWITI